MKIFHASLTREFAGSEMYCASLARAQFDNGDEVRIAVRETPYVKRWKAEAGGAGVVAIPAWVPGFLESWAIGRMMRGFEPDVVHTHLGRADVKAGAAARRLKLPWVTTVHLRWKDEMMKAKGAICIAGWQKADLSAAHYKGIVRTIWNWVPVQNPVLPATVETLRAGWGAGPKTIVFGSVGRLHGQKGMDVLIKAFNAAYPDPETDVRLVIVGQGVDHLKLEGIRGPERRVIFTGYIPDVAPFYEAFDVYVSASRYEPFGLTIVEAMAHGCQLVCTKTEGPSEFLHDASQRGQVLWAERGDAESLAAALRVAQHERKRVSYDMKPFAIERAVQELNDVYEEVILR